MRDFEVEIESLRKAANDNIGGTVRDLELARANVRSTEDNDYAFSGGDGLFETSGNRWDEARHYLDRVFVDNIENLTLSRSALLEIADRYEEADLSAAEGFPR